MTFLKGLALTLLRFLLFLSLSIFGVALMLNLTILNPHFAISELNKLDIPSIAKDFLGQQIPQDEPYVTEIIDNTITDLEPWIREQARDSIYSSYDYFLGRSESLNLEISLERPRDSLKDNIREAILLSPPSELAEAPTALIELYISEAQQYVDEVIPPTFEFNENSLSPGVLSQLIEVKKAIGYVQLTYKVLIALIVLLILGIVLLKRKVRGATRELGIIFITYGAIEYLGIVIAKHLIGTQLLQFSALPSLQTWLPQLIKDLFVPLEIFSLSFLVAGIALIVVSFVYKPRQPEAAEAI